MQRKTRKFDAVTLQSYTDEQIAFIASVEDDYPEPTTLSDITSDYADELADLA